MHLVIYYNSNFLSFCLTHFSHVQKMVQTAPCRANHNWWMNLGESNFVLCALYSQLTFLTLRALFMYYQWVQSSAGGRTHRRVGRTIDLQTNTFIYIIPIASERQYFAFLPFQKLEGSWGHEYKKRGRVCCCSASCPFPWENPKRRP